MTTNDNENPSDHTHGSDDGLAKSKYIAGIIRMGIVLLCTFIAVVLIVSPLIGAFNSLVDADLQVTRAASNVKVDLERRADLLPNLASTVKGSADFEYKMQYDTLVGVAEGRAGETRALKNKIASKPVQDVAATTTIEEQEINSILANFVRLQEQYPTLQLQSVQQFREFGAQVTATENQILMDRHTYNAAVMQYQSVARSFPTNLVANHYGFSADKYTMWQPHDVEHMKAVPMITFDF